MKKLLYHPTINKVLRTIAKPLSPVIPGSFKFPVTGIIKVKVPGGNHILVQCNPTSFVARKLFWEGMDGFEFTMARLFTELAKRAGVFLDVGSNIGYYSLLAAAVNPELKITSFEPAPAVFKYLQINRNLNQFSHITVEQLALSDEEGELTFFISKNPKYLDIAEHHLTSTGSFDKAQADRTTVLESVKVGTITMDQYVARHDVSTIDLIKLDTEATEHLVLAGAQHVLADHKPFIFCEVLRGKVEKEIESAFKKHNYLFFRLEKDRVIRVDSLSDDRAKTNDHLMVHPDKLSIVEPLLNTVV
ncbi:MAG: FkbM family methyltransferase [Rhodothermales bacterium]